MRYHDDVASLEDIAACVETALDGLPHRPHLVLEPGRALVAPSMRLITSVIARTERSGDTWLYLDAGVYNALFEAMIHQGSTRYPVSRHDDAGGPRHQFVLAGPTGDGLDVIQREAMLPETTAPGDLLVFEQTGAYTVAMASSFNGFSVPPVVAASLSDDMRTAA